MIHADGREIRAPFELACDAAIVGSGPAGATVARALARAGAAVVVLEEGPLVEPAQFSEGGFTAMARLYRDLGASVLLGRAPIPYVQGRVVGGTSVVNGAICWRLPRDIHEEWVRADPSLRDALPWEALGRAADDIERDLSIAPTDPAVAGEKSRLMARGADALGIAHRPIARNVRGCEGRGRCLQGCPIGAKLSMDRTYLPDAARAGARILASTRATAIAVERGRAAAVHARSEAGAAVRVRAARAVVLAASAVQTPRLLLASGLRHGPTGENFQCHPGVSVAGRFPAPVRNYEGATQGHEVTGLRADGLKLETLGYPMAILGMRLPSLGRSLARAIEDIDHWTNWGAAIRSTARGRVHRNRITFELTPLDRARLRRAVRVLGELLLAAGADHVSPGIHGWRDKVTTRTELARLEDEAPRDPRAYSLAVTHMFGTCRMGSSPADNVVRPDFRHHAVGGLYVADSSVFPTNTGVNPQTAIMAMAALCAEAIKSS